MEKIEIWFNRYLNWLIRHRRISLTIASLLFVAGAGMLFGTEYFVELTPVEGIYLKVGMEKGTTSCISRIFGFAFFAFGFFVLFYEFYRIVKLDKATRKILITFIGLDEVISKPPKIEIEKYHGKVEPHEINILQFMRERTVVNPEGALTKIASAIPYIKSNLSNTNPDTVEYLYAGLGPGPFIFTIGYLFSNKNAIELWDHDRDAIADNKWYPLNGVPRKDVYSFPTLNFKDSHPDAVVISISLTFKVEDKDIKNICGDLPIIRIDANQFKNDLLKAKENQIEFQKSFRNLINELTNNKVSTIHLFCSSQASIYFRIGQQIDGNHPNTIMYQFTPDKPIKFSWGVSLNNRQNSEPTIIHTEAKQ